MKAIDILKQQVPDSRNEEAALRQQFEQACREEKIPLVTVYVGTGREGWYQMLSSWLFTSREDWRDFWFYFSPHYGTTYANRMDGQGYQELEEWDPEAAIIPQNDMGVTGMKPAERERQERLQERKA